MSTNIRRRKRRWLRESIRRSSSITSRRRIVLVPSSWDDTTRSAAAVFATDQVAMSIDAKTGKGILEVWRMDGALFDDRVPLLDNHKRESIDDVLGSALPSKVEQNGDVNKLVGRIQISEAEPKIATKVKEGHITDVSAGVQQLEAVKIPRGTTRSVGGVEYTAPANQDLTIVTKWRLRELSLPPIGSDADAKIRSEERTPTMKMREATVRYLRSLGLAEDADEKSAKDFYDSLPEQTRALADAAKDDEEGDEEETERAEGDEGDEEGDEPTRRSSAKLRTRGAARGRETRRTAGDRTNPNREGKAAHRERVLADERLRVRKLKAAGVGVPKEVVRKAIDKGWSVQRAAPVFLRALRDRGEPAAPHVPGIHSRSKDKDCTAQALGYGLALRNCNGEELLKRNCVYAPAPGSSGGVGVDYFMTRAVDPAAHRKALERLLNEGDRYRHLSMHDICREACRIDGKQIGLHVPSGETFRNAVSGSALANIFTTNINAEFLSGYMDYTDTTQGWVSESEKNNFLTNEVDTIGKFGMLKKQVKGRPAEHMNTSDSKESYKVARYTGQFVVDEQDIINDRFGAIESETPKDMGLAAAQLRPNLVYAILLANENLDVDGVALFDGSTHKNYVSGSDTALAATALQTAIASMASQRINGRVLNIKPRFLLLPQALWATGKILLTSAQRIIASSSDGTANPLQDVGITLVFDDRLGVGGVIDPRTDTARAGTAANWFLMARPGEEGAKTIEVGYLRGSGRAPSIRSFVRQQGEWGIGWDIKMDIGAKALDFRAMYKSLGNG